MIEKTVSIYALVDPRDGRVRYVGKTEKTIEHRLKQHLNNRKDKTHKQNWFDSLFALGLKPSIVLIEKVSKRNWERNERYWIKYYNDRGFALTNSTPGGGDIPITDEIRKKMSESAKKKIFTEEHRRNMGNARRGRTHTEEAKRKMRESKLGDKNPRRQKVFTEEECKKMSEMSKRRVFTEEYRRNLSIAGKGRVVSEETKRKLSESKKGKPSGTKGRAFSEEHRNKIAAAAKLRTRQCGPDGRFLSK